MQTIMQTNLQDNFPIVSDTFWSTVHKYLKLIGMSQKEFCKNTGLNETYISKAKGTNSKPNDENHTKIERALHIKIRNNDKGDWYLYNLEYFASNASSDFKKLSLLEDKLDVIFEEFTKMEEIYKESRRAVNFKPEQKLLIYEGLLNKISSVLTKFFN